MEDGIHPSRIAYVSYTRKAVDEVTARSAQRFGFTRYDVPYFKTLHSLCFQQCALTRSAVMDRDAYADLGRILGLRFGFQTPSVEDAGIPQAGSTTGDQMLFLHTLCRMRLCSFREGWETIAEDQFSWHHFKLFCDTYDKFKNGAGLVDFTDMLQLFIDRNCPLDVDTVFIDEAQDLSRLQWEVARVAFANAKRVYVAGDDDQAIYRWAGADVEAFHSLQGEKVVLDVSYRLPRSVYTLSQKIIHRVHDRFEKVFNPRTGEAGEVVMAGRWDTVPIAQREGTWLLLARNVYMLQQLETLCRTQGLTFIGRGGHASVRPASARAIKAWEHLRKGNAITGDQVALVYEQFRVGSGVKRGFKGCRNIHPDAHYTITDLTRDHGLLTTAIWHEAMEAMPIIEREYYLVILRRHGGNALTAQPRVHINTIHGVKGGEADNVLLLTDMAARSHKQYRVQGDDENRVFYVGSTRARTALFLCQPDTDRYFDIPR